MNLSKKIYALESAKITARKCGTMLWKRVAEYGGTHTTIMIINKNLELSHLDGDIVKILPAYEQLKCN